MAQAKRKDINTRIVGRSKNDPKIVALKEAAAKGATKSELVDLIKKL